MNSPVLESLCLAHKPRGIEKGVSQSMGSLRECRICGFWDSDYETCTCPSTDKWYACSIESEKPENKQALEEYAEWAYSQESEELE